MSDPVILTDITGGIGTVTLNKPWKLNAWDTPMRAEITTVLTGWNRDVPHPAGDDGGCGQHRRNRSGGAHRRIPGGR